MDTATAAVVISGIALVVSAASAGSGWWQWRVAKDKLKLDLFKERYALFELLRVNLFESLGNDGRQSPELFSALSKFYFLFDKDIGDFATEVHRRGALHMLSLRNLKDHPNPELHAIESAKVTEGYKWFDAQHRHLRDRFKEYLDFKGWS